MPILKPVDFSMNEPVWIITDSSKTGVVLSSCLNVTSELFGYSELLGVQKYRRLSDVQMDFGFSFDAAPTIDMVLYFGVLKMLEMNEDKIEIDR